ncbi:MAG: VCBS repeat-containing protein [Candidatus Omnitrophota bacterium]|nr:MAG: VCBS repeat-containing protein [Candidatus Omnitrophota bacterium]
MEWIVNKNANFFVLRNFVLFILLGVLPAGPDEGHARFLFQNHEYPLFIRDVSFITGDVDGDQDADIIAASLVEGKLYWIENIFNESGNATIDSWPVHVIADIAPDHASLLILHAADFDNDADLDLFVCNKYAGLAITLYENNGETDSAWTPYTVSVQNNQIHFLEAGDLDGDQDMDLLASASSIPGRDKIFWFENNGNPFTDWIYHSVFQESGASAADNAHLADINGDGKLDIVFKSNVSLSWFENIDSLSDTWVMHDLTPEDFWWSSDAAIFDADQDQDPDLLVWVRFAKTFFLFENDVKDHANWVIHPLNDPSLFSSSESLHFSVGDINMDGWSDYIFCFADNQIHWLENPGRMGEFWPAHTLSIGGYPSLTNLESVDLDGDNDMDIVFSKHWSTSLYGLENLLTMPDIPIELQYDFTQGWNLISIPITTEEELTPTALFGEDSTTLTYDTLQSQFVRAATLEMNRGYFVHVPEDRQFTVTGTRVIYRPIPADPTWNLIGFNQEIYASFDQVDFLWQFDNGSKKYTPIPISSLMIPQQAYWISVTGSAALYPTEEFISFPIQEPKHRFTLIPDIKDAPLAYLEMGIDDNADDEFGSEDFLPPPTIPEAGGEVYFLTPREDRMERTVRDVRKSRSGQKWLIAVHCKPTYSFSLTWRPFAFFDLLEAELVELDGETGLPVFDVIDLKSQDSIEFSPNPLEKMERLFQVTLSLDPNFTEVNLWEIY